ncbi:MAG: amino acid permease [Gemmataceae bacterium]|nr:amino acid permease [Gemmataceae bacterium]
MGEAKHTGGTATMADPTAAPPADRRFGYWAGHLVVVGSMIGAGILTTSGFILRDTGNPLAMLALWAMGGALALCGAVTVAELATAIPRSGGDYVFVREAFGPGAGFVSGWATFILGFAAPTAVVALLALKYLASPWGELVPDWAIQAGASALILVIALVHTLGHHHSSRLQLVATVVTAAVLVGLAAGGVCCGNGNWAHLKAADWPQGEHWWFLAVGLIYVCYAYTGWNAAAYLAGEMRDPARTLPRCLVGGAATVVALYLGVNLAYAYALDPAALADKPDDYVEPVANLAVASLFGRDAANVIGAVLGLTLVAGVSAYLLTGPRVAFAMARDRVFPVFAGRLHPTRGTPAQATMTQAAIAAALVWSGSFLNLLNYTAVGLAALAGLTVASVFPLRRRAGLTRPYRLPFYPLPPLAYLVLTVWTIVGVIYNSDSRLPAILSLVTLLVGIPLFQLVREPARGPRRP